VLNRLAIFNFPILFTLFKVIESLEQQQQNVKDSLLPRKKFAFNKAAREHTRSCAVVLHTPLFAVVCAHSLYCVVVCVCCVWCVCTVCVYVVWCVCMGGVCMGCVCMGCVCMGCVCGCVCVCVCVYVCKVQVYNISSHF